MAVRSEAISKSVEQVHLFRPGCLTTKTPRFSSIYPWKNRTYHIFRYSTMTTIFSSEFFNNDWKLAWKVVTDIIDIVDEIRAAVIMLSYCLSVCYGVRFFGPSSRHDRHQYGSSIYEIKHLKEILLRAPRILSWSWNPRRLCLSCANKTRANIWHVNLRHVQCTGDREVHDHTLWVFVETSLWLGVIPCRISKAVAVPDKRDLSCLDVNEEDSFVWGLMMP